MRKKLKKILKSDGIKIGLSLLLFAGGLIFGFVRFEALSLVLYAFALVIAGADVFVDAVKGILRLDPLDEKFLMSVAAIGAMIVGEWSEGCAVMIFYLVGETFEHRAVRKSRASIKALMDICPDEASVLIDGKEEIIDAEDVEIGMTVVIRPGERVAVDCTVTEGTAHVDTSSMTGEPIPVTVGAGDSLSSGVVVTDGQLLATAVRKSPESAAARVLELVTVASDNKSREESFITRFSRYYTPIVVALALVVAVLPPLFGLSTLSKSVYTALTFLVISCPCALVISVPLSFFGGIGGAASRGILFKGGNVFSKIASAETVAFDKTGTITSGRFEIQNIIPAGIGTDELLFIAASVESVSNHPVALCIKRGAQNITAPKEAKELSGLGVMAEVEGQKCAVGNLALMRSQGAAVPDEYIKANGVYVCRSREFIGTITISDSVKPEAAEAIKKLYRLGVKNTVILSGDREENVSRIAKETGIIKYYSQLSPEEKYEKLEALISESKSTVYVGDGINDAPSLARADVGIAMGNMGQDSAIEASDAVIMTDNLLKISEAMLIARKTVRIARENIVFAIGIKALILLLGFFGLANMWLAVFADVGVAVLAVLNAMRALKFTEKYK